MRRVSALYRIDGKCDDQDNAQIGLHLQSSWFGWFAALGKGWKVFSPPKKSQLGSGMRY
jgi:hypothetical protein